MIERWFRTLKYDEVYLNDYQNIRDTIKQIENVINTYNWIWGLQTLEPQDYFGKTIDVYSYIANNHKLDGYGDIGETQLWLLICEGKIIGGYSFPDNSEQLYGGVYSLEGITLEEVSGITFQEWSKKWMEKYD